MDKVNNLVFLGLRGVFYNPPYLPLLMATTTQMCIQLLNNMNKLAIDFTVVSFLPNWVDASYIQYFLDSRYTVFHQMIPKGQYVLHEKDKGKLINVGDIKYGISIQILSARVKYLTSAPVNMLIA